MLQRMRLKVLTITLLALVFSAGGCGPSEQPAVTVQSLKDRLGGTKGKPDPKVRQ